MTQKLTSPVQFRMREKTDNVCPETGVVTDENGQQWGTADALLKLADKLEAQRDSKADALFVPAKHGRVSTEPNVAGGTLDAMSDGIWSERNKKGRAK